MRRLVTISREYGSGGRLIGRLVAEKLSLPFYDKEIIDLVVEKSGLSREVIETAELRAKSTISYSFASTMSFGDGFTAEPISINEKLFITQFDVIRQIGDTGEGVIIGRCADYVLRELPGVTNIFLCAETEDRVRRCIDMYGDDPEGVRNKIKDYDKARANYYNYHTSQKWGAYGNYNLMLNTSYITDEHAADIIVSFVNTRKYNDEPKAE